MSSTKSQVAVATNIPNISSSNQSQQQQQQQKDYNSEESLGRQNSFGMNRRGTMKGKHLTRSHAMREATSPPRTPTPRTSESQMSPNGYQQPATHHHHIDVNEGNNNNNNINSNNNNNNKLHTQSSATRGNSPIIDTPSVIVTSQHKQQQLPPQQTQQQTNVALCNETEFPKLTPPKSKGGGGGGGIGGPISGSGTVSSGHSSNGQQQQQQQPPTQRSNSSSSNNNNPESNINSNNKKTNGDASGSINEAHNKTTSNIANSNSICTANKGYSSSQQQQQQQHQSSYNAGNALQKALKISDNSQQQGQGTSSQPTQNVYNSPMNYQLHPNDGNHQQPTSYIVYDKENRCPRNDSQNSVNSSDEMHFMDSQQSPQQQHSQQQHHQQQQQQSQHHQRSGGSKKHRTNSNSKGSKPRLKNIAGSGGSSTGGGNTSNNGSGVSGAGPTGGPNGGGSIDGSLNSSNNTSGFISRENSNEQYTDHGGTDLLSFFKETLNKNVKDRQFLLKVEKDLIEFVQEGSRGEIRFPQASSYNRMLIHRTAAFFGMEHNVDTETQQCVIVAPTKNTRIPDIRFKTLVIHNRDDSRKSILKRDTHSFDEARQSSYLCPDRGGMLDRKAKSFEEREEDYDRARSRIFNRSQNEACGGSTDDDNNYISWTSSVDQQQFSRGRSSGKVIKIQNSPDRRGGSVVPKGSGYSNYGSNQGGAPLMRGDSVNSNKGGGGGGNGGGTGGNNNRIFSKQDSIGSASTSWRLSPSSSGYKTQTQSVHSDSVTPSPTGGYGSDEHTPDHSSVIANRENIDATTSLPCGLVWAVTDISNVPKGSVLINPQTLQPILNSDGTVYHFDPSNPPPTQAVPTGGNGGTGGGNSSTGMYHSAQRSSSPQQHGMHGAGKKQHKGHQQLSQPQQHQKCQQQFHPVDTTPPPVGVENVSESSTQTVNDCDEVIAKNVGDMNYLDGGDMSNKDDNDECDNSANGCLSITTTTSTKNYDRIEVQKFKNQATSPNIPINEKEEVVKFEHTGQAPTNVMTPSQQQHLLQQQQQPQNRETPHSARSTPFSNSDTLTKRSSEEPRTTSWTQSYQAPDGSTVFHTNTTPNGSNPYCTTTYQQGPDGSIYAVPQGMIYAYPPPVEGEFQGYFMPVFDPTQQRGESTGILQPGTQTLYPTGGTTTMVPVAAYPTAQFTTTNGTPIYPGQVIYSGEQFQTAGAPLATAAPASSTGQLQQIPMTTYPIGYPYPYNGYWGQTMTYYVPQQAVPATSLLTAQAPPQAAPTTGAHVAGGVSGSGPNGLNSTAGPSMNSSNINNSTGASGGCAQNISHQSVPAASGYQPHGNTGTVVAGSNHSSGTTYYGTGRIKRPNPSHFSSGGAGGGHQVLTTTTLPNGVSATTYQLGHAVPTLTLAAAAPAPTAAGAPATSDISAGGATSATATMYALPQHATIFPANMFPYAANAAQAIGPQPTASMAQQAALISQHGNPQVPTHAVGGHPGAAAAGALHNPHHSNTVITPFYTTTHHHNPHAGIPTGTHAIHAPGPAAIPIVDPATLINAVPNGPGNNPYMGRGGAGIGVGGNNTSTSQSAPSTPHSMPSAPHHSQRNPPVFSTPPIMNNNVGHYNSASSTPHYYGGADQSHQPGGGNCCNSPHSTYPSTSYEKRNNGNGGGSGGKKALPYQSASLSRQNSTNTGGYNTGGGKPSSLLGNNNNSNNNNNDTRASPGSNSTNSRPHSMKRSGGGSVNDKPQTPLLSGPPSFAGNANISNNSYSTATNVEMTTGVVPMVNVAKPPVRLNAAAAAFRHKSTASTGSNAAGGTVVDNRRNPASQRNSPSTNASSSNDNSNNNSPNSIQNSSNAATPIAAGCYAPSYMINAQNNGGEAALPHHPPPSLYITTATARGPAHIPPHLQSAAGGAAVSASAVQAAAAAASGLPQQTTTAVLGGAAAAAAAADVANAAAVAAAATVAHHHHPQPLLGTYNPGASGLYFKYGHTYFAHPSVALPNSRRSPSTDLRPPIAQMAGMYPTMNMMIPAQPRHPGRHPNPNYKGTRPR